MKLLFYPAIDDAHLNTIRAAVTGAKLVNAADGQTALAEVANSDGFIGKITPELLRVAPRLRWVQAPTSSLGQYMFPELVEHPCVLTSMRGLFSDIIADHVFGYILCFARNFHRYIRNQVQERWQPVGSHGSAAEMLKGIVEVTDLDRAHLQLSETTLGLVGLGHVGTEIARRGSTFGMRVVATDPVQTAAPEGVSQLWRPNGLQNLLAESDFVVITVPHTPETVKMFRREQFQQMKRTAYLINVSRGVTVDIADLTAALEAGEIAGAGLDVFEVEPLPSGHPLWKMENVIITPHVGGYSAKLPERFWNMIVENVQNFVQGKPLRNVVNKTLGF